MFSSLLDHSHNQSRSIRFLPIDLYGEGEQHTSILMDRTAYAQVIATINANGWLQPTQATIGFNPHRLQLLSVHITTNLQIGGRQYNVHLVPHHFPSNVDADYIPLGESVIMI